MWVGTEPCKGMGHPPPSPSQDVPQPQLGPPGTAVPVWGPQTPYCSQETSHKRCPRAGGAQPWQTGRRQPLGGTGWGGGRQHRWGGG